MFRAFGDDQLNVWVTQFPYVWIAVMVAAALFGHIVTLRKLLAESRAKAAAADGGGNPVRRRRYTHPELRPINASSPYSAPAHRGLILRPAMRQAVAGRFAGWAIVLATGSLLRAHAAESAVVSPRPKRVLALFDMGKDSPANVIWDRTTPRDARVRRTGRRGVLRGISRRRALP